MPTHITIKKFLVVLKMPRKIGDKISRLHTIDGKISTSTYFSGTGWTATVTLAQFEGHIAAYIQADTNVKNHVAGASGVRTAAWATIEVDLNKIEAMVADKVAANLPLAEAIITSAGFFVGISHIKQKLSNDAFNTEIVGTILLTGEGGGPHEYEMSKDKVTIIRLDTDTSTTHVPGKSSGVPALNTGDIWYFRMRKVNTKKTTYAWSKWIELKIGSGGKNLGGIVISVGGSLHNTQ